MKKIRKSSLESIPEDLKPALSEVEWEGLLLWDEGCRITQKLVELSKKLDLYWDCFMYEDADEMMVKISTHLNRFREINKEMENVDMELLSLANDN